MPPIHAGGGRPAGEDTEVLLHRQCPPNSPEKPGSRRIPMGIPTNPRYLYIPLSAWKGMGIHGCGYRTLKPEGIPIPQVQRGRTGTPL